MYVIGLIFILWKRETSNSRNFKKCVEGGGGEQSKVEVNRPGTVEREEQSYGDN
jgi:hypothetical protein